MIASFSQGSLKLSSIVHLIYESNITEAVHLKTVVFLSFQVLKYTFHVSISFMQCLQQILYTSDAKLKGRSISIMVSLQKQTTQPNILLVLYCNHWGTLFQSADLI